MPSPKKSPAELAQEAENQAQDALKHMAPPEQVRLSGPPEEEQAAQAEAQAQAERAEEAGQLDVEQRLEQMAAIIAELTAKPPARKGQTPDNPLILMPTPEQPVEAPAPLSKEQAWRPVVIYVLRDADGTMEPIHVNVGDQWKFAIPRECNVRVPFCVTKVLDDAVIRSKEFLIEGNQYLAQKKDLTPLTVSEPVETVQKRFHYMIVG